MVHPEHNGASCRFGQIMAIGDYHLIMSSSDNSQPRKYKYYRFRKPMVHWERDLNRFREPIVHSERETVNGDYFPNKATHVAMEKVDMIRASTKSKRKTRIVRREQYDPWENIYSATEIRSRRLREVSKSCLHKQTCTVVILARLAFKHTCGCHAVMHS
jgi:hypothetical protein